MDELGRRRLVRRGYAHGLLRGFAASPRTTRSRRAHSAERRAARACRWQRRRSCASRAPELARPPRRGRTGPSWGAHDRALGGRGGVLRGEALDRDRARSEGFLGLAQGPRRRAAPDRRSRLPGTGPLRGPCARPGTARTSDRAGLEARFGRGELRLGGVDPTQRVNFLSAGNCGPLACGESLFLFCSQAPRSL